MTRNNPLHTTRSLFSLLVVFLFVQMKGYAQQNNSLYFMEGIPQSNQLNPATQPRFGLYIGMPALSSIEVNAGNSTFGFNDLAHATVNDILQIDTLLPKALKNNFINGELRIDWLSFGFRINESYVYFSAGERLVTYANIPNGFLGLAGGNLTQVPATPGTTKTFNLNNFGVNATWYREYALGYATQVNDQLFFGLRGKLLFGLANLSTSYSNSSITATCDTSNQFSWQTQSYIQMRSSIPQLNVYYTGNNFDSVKIKNKILPHDLYNMAMSTRNPGVALDLGMIYKLSNSLSISASIIDLGFIQWHNNIHNAQISGTYNFLGVPINSTKQILISDLLDSLKQGYPMIHDQNSYITTLSGKIYVGAYFQPVKWMGLGALSRTQIRDGLLDQQYTLSLNLIPAKTFNFTMAYTIVDHMYDNLGVGFYFMTGPLQWYFMTERIPLYWDMAKFSASASHYIPVPYDEKDVNFHMGLNLLFGSDRSVRIMKLKKDKPLVDVENHPW